MERVLAHHSGASRALAHLIIEAGYGGEIALIELRPSVLPNVTNVATSHTSFTRGKVDHRFHRLPYEAVESGRQIK